MLFWRRRSPAPVMTSGDHYVVCVECGHVISAGTAQTVVMKDYGHKADLTYCRACRRPYDERVCYGPLPRFYKRMEVDETGKPLVQGVP